jgi:hypothetical protein
MKVVVEGSTSLTTDEKRKVSLLKLTEEGKYLKGVGIRDTKYFVLMETPEDDEYLSFMGKHKILKKTYEEHGIKGVLQYAYSLQWIKKAYGKRKNKESN